MFAVFENYIKGTGVRSVVSLCKTLFAVIRAQSRTLLFNSISEIISTWHMELWLQREFIGTLTMDILNLTILFNKLPELVKTTNNKG